MNCARHTTSSKVVLDVERGWKVLTVEVMATFCNTAYPGSREQVILVEKMPASIASYPQKDGAPPVREVVSSTSRRREEFADFPRLGVAGKKKILGLNAARLYGIDVPAEYQIADQTAPAARDDAQLVDDRSQQPVAGA